ncbi:hypothetical protein [Marinifilum fragile]
MSTLANQYYLKALDLYPYDLEESMENLNYALSFDQDHIGANYLMGKLHLEQLNEYESAEEYFITAMASHSENANVCMDYASLLIQLREYDRANDLLSYAKKIKGVDLSKIKVRKALIHEHKGNYKKAIKVFRKALLNAYNEEEINKIEEDVKRVKMKKKLVSKTKKKKEE